MNELARTNGANLTFDAEDHARADAGVGRRVVLSSVDVTDARNVAVYVAAIHSQKTVVL